MTVGRYATPPAFKQALEQRLRSDSTSGTDFARRRQILVFDRFLARLTQTLGVATTTTRDHTPVWGTRPRRRSLRSFGF